MPPGHAFHPGPAGRGPIYRFGFFAGPAWKAAEKGEGKKRGNPLGFPGPLRFVTFAFARCDALPSALTCGYAGDTRGQKRRTKTGAGWSCAGFFRF